MRVVRAFQRIAIAFALLGALAPRALAQQPAWAAVDGPRAERVVFAGRGLTDEETLLVTAALAGSGHPGVFLLDTPGSHKHVEHFLKQFGPAHVVAVQGSAPPSADDRPRAGGPSVSPAELQQALFPTARRIVVAPVGPRRLLVQAACLAGSARAPLVVCRGEKDDAGRVRKAVGAWQAKEVLAVGNTYRVCRDLGEARTVRLLDEQAVVASCLKHQAKKGPLRALVAANPADAGRPGGMSALAPWLAVQRRGALLLTNDAGDNLEAVARQALQHEAVLRADALILVADHKAIPVRRRPNPVPDSKDEHIEMEPLTPTGDEPFTFATGRLFHPDPGFVTLVLARQRLMSQEKSGARKALVASNSGESLPLLEALSRHTAREIAGAGYEMTALFGREVSGARVRKLLPQQDLFVWEGHHSTLVRDYRIHQWDEPLRPSLVFLQSCLALTEAKALPFLERGAVGVIGSSTRTYSGSGGALTLAYFDALLHDGQSLGGSLRQGKNFLLTFAMLKEKRLGERSKLGGINVRTAWAYTLWGDPTLKLPRPETARDAAPRASHKVRGQTIVLNLPEETQGKVVSGPYYADVPSNVRLAGLKSKQQDDDGHRLVAFAFAEVRLPKVPAGQTPRLRTRLPDDCWVFCWDGRRGCGYLLVRPRAKDRGEVRFQAEW